MTRFRVLVPGIGTEVKGSRRWLRFLGQGFQPSEAAAVVEAFAPFARVESLIVDGETGFTYEPDAAKQKDLNAAAETASARHIRRIG